MKVKAASEPERENTYGLPRGSKIKGMLLRWFRRQLKAILGTLKTIGVDLPARFPSLADYNDPMAAAMTPIISAYWDTAGRKVRERLGLDAAEWRVTDPHLAQKIQTAAFDFCAATNATTTKQLNAALADLRDELAEGLVEQGDTLKQLRKRVQSVFEHAENSRAQRIAATEASRAVHAAEYQSAKESGVVAGFEWLVSSDACPLCQRVAAEAKYVKVEQPFATGMGKNPAYSTVKHPPLHPGCQCSMLEVLTPEHGGPSDVPWAAGPFKPEPKPVKPKPKPPAAAPPSPLPGPTTSPVPRSRPVVPPVVGMPVPPAPPEPVPGPVGPHGVSVSDALKLPTAKPLREAIRGGLDAVDRVHGDGKLAEIPLKLSKSERENGSFTYGQATGRAMGMAISTRGDHPELTLVHEIGHMLERTAITGAYAGDRDFSTAPEFSEWFKAIKESRAVKGLKAIAETPGETVSVAGPGASPSAVKINVRYIRYLLQHDELWARSYAQYIAVRSGDKTLLDQVKAERAVQVYGGRQWDDDDFEPIAQAIDAMFLKLGWRK